MTCTHTLTDEREGGHRCFCCGRFAAPSTGSSFCPSCRPPEKEIPKRRDLTKEVESATVEGSCGFCGAPTATFQFKGDSTLLICERCVKG